MRLSYEHIYNSYRASIIRALVDGVVCGRNIRKYAICAAVQEVTDDYVRC